MPNESKLKVMEALQEEAYKGIVRIDAETMNLIGVRPGDVIEIEGARLTVGIVDRAYPTDVGQSVIRMDGILRRNAKTGIGEYVVVRRAEVKEAKAIQIAPAQKGVVIQADPEVFKRSLLGRAAVKGDIISPGGTKRRRRTMSGSPYEDIFEVFEQGFMGSFGFGGLKFVVVSTNPKGSVIISDDTEVTVSSKAIEVFEEKVPDVTYEDIGGLDEEIKKIREMVELPLKHPEIFERLGVEPPGGVLLHGPPGSGKTLLAKAVANESDANFLLINGPEIVNKYYGETEKRLREIFEEADKNAPSIIFIDEIDAIAPKREETHGEVERRMVATLLVLLDGLQSRGKVIVIGATNRPNALDPALRRPGRFDRELTIGVPNRNGRLEVLKVHTRNMPLDDSVNLDELADLTHGYVGADLLALCKEAALSVLRRLIPELKLEQKEKIPREVLDQISVSNEDFKEALRLVRPSGLREVLIEIPKVSWEDIGGLEKQKQELIEAVEWPLKHAEAFKRVGIKPPKGILMYGPPGTGKTLMAKAAAKESDANFILVKGPELINMWIGESEKGIRKIFEKARQAAPTIIFFDEIDAIAPRRGMDVGSKVTERIVNTLLVEMDGLVELNDVVVIAATNRPDIIDPALLRPGRFDRMVLMGPPDVEAREQILMIHARNMPLAADVDMRKIAEETEGFVGADIEALCREAGFVALRKDMASDIITMEHFEEALDKISPSITVEAMEAYTEMEKEYLKKARAGMIKDAPSYLG